MLAVGHYIRQWPRFRVLPGWDRVRASVRHYMRSTGPSRVVPNSVGARGGSWALQPSMAVISCSAQLGSPLQAVGHYNRSLPESRVVPNARPAYDGSWALQPHSRCFPWRARHRSSRIASVGMHPDVGSSAWCPTDVPRPATVGHYNRSWSSISCSAPTRMPPWAVVGHYTRARGPSSA